MASLQSLWLNEPEAIFQNKNLQNRSAGSGAGILPGTFCFLADSLLHNLPNFWSPHIEWKLSYQDLRETGPGHSRKLKV